MSIIKVTKLVKKYGDTIAVNNLNLDIKKGEIYGLLGPNGAGKTTFINIICDMIKRDSGDIFYNGEKITKSFNIIKNDIGVVPQNLAIYEDLTAKENVMFFASLYGLKGKLLKERALEALEFVGLLEQEKKYPKTFSGGMKRRLNIACAIAHHPKLIMMDEPTAGIDPQSRNHILNSVRKLNKLGSTIIYTTHYMEEVEAICTRVGIIDFGKLIAEGTCEELTNIVTDRKKIIISVSLKSKIDEDSLKNVKGVLSVMVKEQEVTVECLKESDCISDILENMNKLNVVIRDIKMEGVSLETAFLSLTGRRLRD